MKEEAGYVCVACGEEIVLTLDLSAGSEQKYVEDCPVCCRPNVIHVEVDEAGDVRMGGRKRMPADQSNRMKKPARTRGFVCHPLPGLAVRSSLALILSGLAPVTFILAGLVLVLTFLVPLALALALLLPLALVLAPLVLACRSWSGWSWSWLCWYGWCPGLWSWLGRSWLRWPWLCRSWLR
jgi:hypothetical protein